VPVIALVRYVI